MSRDDIPEVLRPGGDFDVNGVDAVEDAHDPPPNGWQPPRRGVAMRHPTLLLLILAAAIFMIYAHVPIARYVLQSGDPADVGDITDRPDFRAEGQPVPALTHDRFSVLSGIIESTRLLWTGRQTTDDEGKPQVEGRRYYVKLAGDKVFIVLDAERADIDDYRLRHEGALLGFHIERESGRMFDADREPGYRELGAQLRARYGLDSEQTVWVFDTTDQPTDRWYPTVVIALMTFIAGLALFGLIRVGRQRLRGGTTA